jgi:hypothetical protein
MAMPRRNHSHTKPQSKGGNKTKTKAIKFATKTKRREQHANAVVLPKVVATVQSQLSPETLAKLQQLNFAISKGDD